MYRFVHTGPNIQFGELKDGLFKVVYHSGTDRDVKIPAKVPKANGKSKVKAGSKIIVNDCSSLE